MRLLRAADRVFGVPLLPERETIVKVRELIEKLGEFEPEAEVRTYDPGCGCCSNGLEPLDPDLVRKHDYEELVITIGY